MLNSWTGHLYFLHSSAVLVALKHWTGQDREGQDRAGQDGSFSLLVTCLQYRTSDPGWAGVSRAAGAEPDMGLSIAPLLRQSMPVGVAAVLPDIITRLLSLNRHRRHFWSSVVCGLLQTAADTQKRPLWTRWRQRGSGRRGIFAEKQIEGSPDSVYRRGGESIMVVFVMRCFASGIGRLSQICRSIYLARI